MSGIVIWTAALTAYGIFSFWYNNTKGRLTPEEVGALLGKFQTDPENAELAENARTFLEADDGKQFFMVNLIKLSPGAVEMPITGDKSNAEEILKGYTGHFMPALLKRAGHVAFGGRGVGRYLEAWGVEPDPGWTFTGVIRYRSRRDMMELATDPKFDSAHVYKIAALSNTFAFPVSGVVVLFGPRVWVPMGIALAAALTHLALLVLANAA